MKLKLELEPNELDYIANALADKPWREANALMVNIQRQVQEQQNGTTTGNGADATDGRSESAKLASVG